MRQLCSYPFFMMAVACPIVAMFIHGTYPEVFNSDGGRFSLFASAILGVLFNVIVGVSILAPGEIDECDDGEDE